MDAKVVLDYIYLEIETEKLMAFLKAQFGNVNVIESYQKFIRTKVEDDHKLSRLFGDLERNVSPYFCKA